MRRMAMMVAMAALLFAVPAAAEPASLRVEDVVVTTINGSIREAGLTYEISVTRSSGRYLAGGTGTPGSTFTRTTGCMQFASAFFTSKQCASMKDAAFTQDAEMKLSKGSFRVMFREIGLKVGVSFSVSGMGATTNEPPVAFSVSAPDRAAAAGIGPWSHRAGKPSGSIAAEGFPKVKIGGRATMARGSGTTAGVDL